MSFLQSFFGATKRTALSESTTVLSMVTGIASLVSTPVQIDPLLDKVRAITSRLQPGQAPSEADENVLLGTYLQIEQYLVQKDQARKFTKEEIRGSLNLDLLKRLEIFESKGASQNV